MGNFTFLFARRLSLILFLFTNIVLSQSFCPQDPIPQDQVDLRESQDFAQGDCPANDIIILGASLDTGETCNSCESGDLITTNLLITINHGTNSGNRFLGVFADLTETLPDGSTQTCRIARSSGPVLKSSEQVGNQQILDYGEVTFTCGSSLVLDNILLAWTAANGSAPITEQNVPNGKFCYDNPTINVVPPLNAVATAECSEGKANIDLNVTGGTGSFSYTWTGPNGFTSNLEDPQDVPQGETLSVTVTDADGCTTTTSITTPVCFVCPEFQGTGADPLNFCEDQVDPFNSFFIDSDVVDVVFRVFPSSTTDPYTGGTPLGTAVTPFGSPLRAQVQLGSLPVGTHYIYAILDVTDPDLTDPLCRPFDSFVANVYGKKDAGEDGMLTICAGETVTEEQLFAALGGTPDMGGTWTPTLSGAGTYTYTIAASGSCPEVSADVVVDESPKITPIFDSVDPICEGGIIYALPTDSNNGITGTWSPALDNTQTTEYTFTPSDMECANEVTLTITVYQIPNAPIVEVVDETCEVDGSAVITNYSSEYEYIFKPSGPTVDQTGNIIGFDLKTEYTITTKIIEGCEASTTAMINQHPCCFIEIQEQPQDLTVCPYSEGHFMNVVATASGSLEYEWEYSIDGGASWYTFVEEDAYSDVFHYPSMTSHFNGKLVRVHLTTDGCDKYSEVAEITWSSVPHVSFTAFGAVSIGSGIQENLSGGSPVGGTYSGPGVTDNGDGTYDFDPAMAGVGEHSLVYTYENENGCSAMASTMVEVLGECSIEIQEHPKDLMVCPYSTGHQMNVVATASGDLSYEWEYSIDGGSSWHIFTEEDVNFDTFNYPSLTQHFNGKLVRVHLSTDGCDKYSDVAEITWNSVPHVSFTAFGEVSIGSGIQENLSGGSPVGGTYSGPGVRDNGNGTYDFDPSVAGIGQHTLSYTYENESGCSTTASDYITVTSILIPDCSLEIVTQPMFSQTCLEVGESTNLSIEVMVNNNATLTYKWQVSINGTDWADISDVSSKTLSDISFDTNFGSSMAYRIMVSSDNGTPENAEDDCMVISSIATIYAIPAVSLNIPTTVSLDTEKFTLEEGTPTGGVYFGDGVIENIDGSFSFDPEVAGEGTHNILYEYTNEYGCSNNAEATIRVTPATDDFDILINEFQPNPAGSDPSTQNLELKGEAGQSFTGWVVILESDSGNPGTINDVEQITGTFGANGLLNIPITDVENPSFTLLITDEFTTGVTDFDMDDDGLLDADISNLGNVYDAIGVPDAASDEGYLYGAQLGGEDFKFTGAEPQLIFRDRNTDAWYAINSHGGDMVHDIDANMVPFTSFNGDLTAPTFGAENPYQISIAIDLTIRAWPNPTTETLNLDMTGFANIKTFELYDMSGKLIRIVPAYQSGKQQLDVRDLKTGIYILRAKAKTNGFINKRFIIRR